MPPTLSICIPTHQGRAGTLAYGLDALLSQARGGIDSRIEICISDNASADGTEQLVRNLAADSPLPIRYRRNVVDIGPGRNIVQAIDMASGEYCWIMSSDDAFAEGALHRMLELLAEHPGVGGVSTACAVFDRVMERRLPAPTDRFPAGDRTREIEGLSSIVEELGSCFIGMSTQVVQRRAWLQCAGKHRNSRLVDGLLPHIAFLVGAAYSQPTWLWCPEPLIRWRSGAWVTDGIDDFMARILDDLASSLLAHLDPRDPGYRHAVAKFARVTYSPRALRNMAALPTHTARGRWRLARVLVRRLYWLQDFWWPMAPNLLLPAAVIKASRRARALARKLVSGR